MSQTQADHFKLVFGEDGKRNSSQEVVWKTVMSRIFQTSRTEAETKETGRDYALFIHNLVNKNTNGPNSGQPEYHGHGSRTSR